MPRQPMLDLARDIFKKGGVVPLTCHAGCTPVSVGIVKAKRATSVSAIKDDLINAGTEWEDLEVVHDGMLISSSGVDDLPALCRTIINATGRSCLKGKSSA
jgi:protease I